MTGRAWRWCDFAVRNTLRNRRRSLVTVAVAALGTAAILIAGGFALSTYESLSQMSARLSGHLVLGQPAQFDQDEDTPLQHGLDHPLDLARALRADPAVRTVLPRIQFSGLVSNGEKSTVMLGSGIDPDSEFSVKGPFLKVVAGDVLTSASTEPEVMLGEALARSLKAVPGSSLTLLAGTTDGALNAIDVRVRGVFATGTPEVDKRAVMTDVATAQRLLVTERVSTLGVFLNRMADTPAAQARLAAAHPTLAVQTWLDQAAMYKSVRALYDIIFGALGVVIGVIVVFVVGNAMAATIVERTREIGTLRTLGTAPSQLLVALSLEGVVLGGAGAMCGALFAAGVSLLLYLVPVQMPPPPGRSTGYPLVVSIDAGLYLAVTAAMVVLAMAASAWIARRTVHRPLVAALAHT